MTRLKDKYLAEAVPALREHFNYRNVMQVPRLVKININTGLGEAISNPKILESAEKDITAISGQHPVITRSKRSIAAFKLRDGMPIGMTVTLRGERMFHFLDKLINIVLPRIREFNGVPRSAFDGRGNYSLGMKEQTYFPELEYDDVDKVRGLQITIVTTARTDDEGRELLQQLGMPLSKDGE